MNLRMPLWMLAAGILVGMAAFSLGCQSHESKPLTVVSITEGWVRLCPQRGPEPASAIDIDGAKALEYKTDSTATDGPLVAPSIPIAGFSKLNFRIWSQEKSALAVLLEDDEKASFHAIVPLEPNCWTEVSLTPNDFQVNDDSPAKRDSLDAERVGSRLMMMDLGKMVGLKTGNTVHITGMTIDYGRSQTNTSLNLPEVIDGTTVTITDSGSITRRLVVRNGGTLVFKSADVHIAANIELNHGTIEVHGGRISVDNRYPHQFLFVADNRSEFSLLGCEFASPHNTMLVVKNSQLRIQKVQFHGSGFTCFATTSRVALDESVGPGEFVVTPGTRFSVNGCRALALWLAFGKNQNADLQLPPMGKRIENFGLPAESKLDLSLSNSEGIVWALLTDPGADLTVRNSEIAATGLNFVANSPVTVANLNADFGKLDLSDRKIRFIESKVHTFNVYPRNDSHVQVADSTFGELNTNEAAEVVVRDSTCDGKGGYLRVSDKTKARLVNCNLNCAVVAADQGQLTLDHCRVNGPVTASDDGRIKLLACSIHGPISEMGHGRVEK